MKVEIINRHLSYIRNYDTDDNFEHKTETFGGDLENLYLWFEPSNLYPETVINEIRNGTTLESILYEDVIYKTGAGFNSNDAGFLTYIEEEKFKNTFKKSNDHLNKLGNIFLEITTDEIDNLISIIVLQPQKCRLSKEGTVIIWSKWKEYKKDKAVELPLYPKFKNFKEKGIKYKKSVYHIKNDVLGFDHYGVNPKMSEALILNEKEHRRLNWQLSQIKRGFKRDFFLVTEFELNESEKKKADEAFKKMSGDGYAGGVETIAGEGVSLVPAQGNYDFDFEKDDTTEQLFLKLGFPRSLIGIKSGAAFSVDQIESDYDQYLPKVEEQQTFLIGEFKTIFENHTKFNVKDWNVINTPPSIIIQNYMQYMTDEQKSKVIENVFKRYGI